MQLTGKKLKYNCCVSIIGNSSEVKVFFLFRGSNLWKPHGTRGVFGGQVIGQALVAAGKTIEEHWHVHSVHGYFLHKGKMKIMLE